MKISCMALLSQAKKLSVALLSQDPALLVTMFWIRDMQEPLPEVSSSTNQNLERNQILTILLLLTKHKLDFDTKANLLAIVFVNPFF